jgi:hypothetical protein
VLFVWIAINARHLVDACVRSVSIHSAQPDSLLSGCGAGADHYDEPKSAEARDRLRAENDYKVNLKAELEIRHLHEKLDHLLRRQYNRLFEIQQIQIELLEEIGRKRKS